MQAVITEVERARVEVTVKRAVEASGTVGRTLQQAATVDLKAGG